MAVALSSRWSVLRPHDGQRAFYREDARFVVVPAGRRSGKTETAKRRLVRRALLGSDYDAPRYFAAAPTREQAKRIWWNDLKRMVPAPAIRGTPSESELTIPLWHGGEIVVVGLDKPERMEGAPWDGGVIDEIANVKPQAWGENIRPALSDRRAWCDLIGVPEGRNHYFDLYQDAKTRQAAGDRTWATYTWTSDTVLPAEEIEEAKRTLDPQTYAQEYLATFNSFSGRAYYAFGDDNVLPVRALYDPQRPLIICLDFNVAPGVAAVCQEVQIGGRWVTGVIGQVWIADNSNTPAVCRRLLLDWGAHRGGVQVYGDATGGARGTAQIAGSDWDLVKAVLTKGDGEFRGFGNRVVFHVKPSNPPERARVNAVNARCCTMEGVRWLYVDPEHAPRVVRDLEGVRVLEGGSGEIDKKSTPQLTHISDALGYYLDFRFPTARAGATMHALAA